MNRPEPDVGEFSNKAPEYLADDEVPPTLVAVLKHFAADLLPESRAACERINTWLSENPDIPAGTEVERGVGMCEFEVQGARIAAEAQPFRFYVLNRLQSAFEAMSAPDQQAVIDLLASCHMLQLLDLKLARDIGRANNLEVWL